jgi:phytoene synthase
MTGRRVTLEESYAECRRLTKLHGTTYYWATQLLPGVSRPHVHALYGFCRYADDIVDDLGPAPVERRSAALASFTDQFFHDLECGRSDHLVLRAVVHTMRAYSIDPDLFRRFVTSMEMDLRIDRYETWQELCRYMDGSACVIGEMMLPILEPTTESAVPHARDLGLAFQLTNFLRDVGEDLDRGRIYLPQQDLERFGVDPTLRRVTPAWRELMRFEIDRARHLYRSADLGIAALPGRSARSIQAARVLYSEILDRIEENDYDVFSSRARVPLARKLVVAAAAARPRSTRSGVAAGA